MKPFVTILFIVGILSIPVSTHGQEDNLPLCFNHPDGFGRYDMGMSINHGPYQRWIAIYNGPYNNNDIAYAVSIDAFGNVYVTGSSVGSGTNIDCATIKYDADGTELWVTRYNGLGNGNDGTSSIALDADGNVYVTGDSDEGETDFDYITIKYDTDGNDLWVAHYDGPGSGNDIDRASAIALDTFGNVYVTGHSEGSGTSFDYATIKYDTDGNELWVARYDGPVNGGDIAGAIALDSDNNVYVTGYSVGSETGSDYATIKYDTDGNELWAARYNGPESLQDKANSIALDENGNVYVTGYSESSGTSKDYATIKYDSNGTELWVAFYDGPGNDQDRASAIILDLDANVYIAGISENDELMDSLFYAIIKYDMNGNELWAVRYDGPENYHWEDGPNLAVDAEGNLYMTGTTRKSISDLGSNYTTLKYDQEGNEIWSICYDDPNYDNHVRAIALDADGNVYVTGKSSGDYATIKYTENPPAHKIPVQW